MQSYLSSIRFLDPIKEKQYAQRILNYIPLDAAGREENKKIAWEDIKSSDLNRQLAGVHLLIRCHYDRSLESAMQDGYWHKHPRTVHEFGRMVDYEGDPMIPAALLAEFRRRNGQYKPGHIEKGSTYWEPNAA